MEQSRRLIFPIFLCLGALALPLISKISDSQDAARSESIIVLPELERPRQLAIERGMAFFADERDVVVYDLASGRFLRRVGKRGQGPGEFAMGPGRITFEGSQLLVGDFNGSERFSLDGTPLGRIKDPESMGGFPLLPVGENYVGFPRSRGSVGTGNAPTGRIYDRNLKPLKSFFGAFSEEPPPPPMPGGRSSNPEYDWLLVRDFQDYIVYRDRIYVADSRKGISISVFDTSGAFLKEIWQPSDRIKITPGFKAEVLREWKSSKYWTGAIVQWNPIFPEYLPAMIGLKIRDGRIYVVTPVRRGRFYEVIIMDLEGTSIERSFRFPFNPVLHYSNPRSLGLKYDVFGDKFHWFEYNDAVDSYELHIL